MAANSKMSQILNGAENFLSANANAARDLVVNPIVDLGSYAAKGYARGGAMLLGKDPDKAAAAVDKVADILKTGGGYNAKQEVDPTSIAGAIGDGLIRGVDQAAAVLTLAEAAKQLPKAAQKGWNKILNKVKDAKSKKQQMDLAKEAREYINSYADDAVEVDQKFRGEVPSYQQRRSAEFRNLNAHPFEEGVMEKYRGVSEEPAGAMKTLDNITDEFAKTKNSNIRSMVVDSKLNPDAYGGGVYGPNSGTPMNVANNRTTPHPVNATTTSDANGLRWQQYRKWTYGDRLKNTGKEFAAQKNAIDKAAKAVDYDNYANANKVAKANGFKDGKDLIKSETAWRNSKEGKEYIKQIESNDLGFKDMSEANNTFIETKAPFNSVKEMLDYISTAKKPTKGIYPKSFVDRPDIMKFSGGDGSLANIADAQEKYNWYMNSYPSYLERIRNTRKNFTSQGKEYIKQIEANNKAFVKEAPTPRSKLIRTEEEKYANDLGITIQQLRDEAKEYGAGTKWYYETKKALDKLGVKDMKEFNRVYGLDGTASMSIDDIADYYKKKLQRYGTMDDYLNVMSSPEERASLDAHRAKVRGAEARGRTPGLEPLDLYL